MSDVYINGKVGKLKDAEIQWVDDYGNVVERPKHSYPYNYSPHANWQHPTELDSQNGGFYTDRAFTWDYEKYNTLCQKHFGNHGQYWNDRDPKKIEAWVRDYNDDQTLILTSVVEHCNQSSGFPLWYLGYYTEKVGE